MSRLVVADTADFAVVVDALRASATADALLAVGAEYVRPVREACAADVGDDTVLVGEENGTRIEGFDFTNSPTAIREAAARIEGKGVVLRTTNGTRCVTEVEGAAEVFVGSLVNRGALTRTIIERARGRDAGRIWFVPARRRGEYAREDMYSCLRLREHVADALGRDICCASRYLGDSAEEVFANCDTGEYLASLGYGDDVAYCATVDGNAAVPRLDGDRFVNAAEWTTVPETASGSRTVSDPRTVSDSRIGSSSPCPPRSRARRSAIRRSLLRAERPHRVSQLESDVDLDERHPGEDPVPVAIVQRDVLVDVVHAGHDDACSSRSPRSPP